MNTESGKNNLIYYVVGAAAVVILSFLYLGYLAFGNDSAFKAENGAPSEISHSETNSETPDVNEEFYAFIPNSEKGSHVNTAVFYNYWDGYSITVPDGFFEADLSRPEIRTVLENDNVNLEIYKQELAEGETIASYLAYSKRSFERNKIDHKEEYDYRSQINGKDTYVLQWSREKLSKVPNDRNHYACVEIVDSDRTIYTLFFKSDSPFQMPSDYMRVAKTFYTDESIIKPHDSKESDRPSKMQPQSSIASGLWTEKTKDAYQLYFGKDAALTWGIYEPGAPEDLTSLNALERQLNYRFPILVRYKEFKKESGIEDFSLTTENARLSNRILELTLQTAPEETGTGNMVYDILNGKYDQFLDEMIESIKVAEQPVLFRFCNEMNGDWCLYSAFHTSMDTNVFQALYKYVYHKFEAQGALPYTIWVWNPNSKSFPDFQWNHQDLYYPGDRYVDVVGLTAYNTGTYYPDEEWKTFDQLYKEPYGHAVSIYDKPLMITEFASSSIGGDKGAWMLEMFDYLRFYSKIKVAVWWNHCDYDSDGRISRPYWLNETDRHREIFKEGLSHETDDMERQRTSGLYG